ncbi:MAG: alanine--tRNA ligase [Trueperaceae bacterium]|nr:alanine--tRNA ligase [Trueperaceae bacterium]
MNELREKYLRFFQDRGHLIHPSASLKSDDPTLMFTSAGMVQFKPYFLGATPKFAGVSGTWHRVTTAQKCLRINDIENVGRTLRHHSFFEMLGNFSFGDYFKPEAAAWAWEFATSSEYLGLDPERLYVTVYQDDDEAFRIWSEQVGVPEARISRWGEDDNFWPANAVSKGPNGPCGPCSEIFYDRGPDFGSADESGPNTGSGDRYIEFWNLVFTQFDRRDGGHLEPLPQKNIDTGLGFERLVAVMTGLEDAYATELFQPTIRRVSALSGVPYAGKASVSHRVIADHLRAVAFAITDGVLPANDGAGYVVKMLVRRASRHAWLLGLREPVLHTLVDQVVEAMGEPYPELKDGAQRVKGIIQAEEEQFLRTLEAGIQRVGVLLDDLRGSVLPGDVAFDLWQTYGFPLDLTSEMAAERGVEVDADGYEAARERARELSRGGTAGRELFAATSDALGKVAERVGETEFLGYRQTEGEAAVVALVTPGDAAEETDALGEGATGTVILGRTPFYPEGGGQVGDAGVLEWEGGKAIVSGTSKSRHGLTLHHARVVRGTLTRGQSVVARVDPARRETEKHHSATHLLHAALRDVLGAHVAQAGSLVAPDRLRFDFSHPHAVSPAEQRRVEELVNRWVQDDLPVDWRVVPIAEARGAGAMMLFGEKYGERVRMVSMGELPHAVSRELCGGTHVARTGQIGPFVIVAEEAVSSGVRRVEARVGASALRYLQELRDTQGRLAAHLGGRPSELEERLTKLQADHKEALKEAARLRDRLAAAQTNAGGAGSETREAGGYKYLTALLDGLDANALRNAADALLTKSGADVVAVASGNALVVKVSPAAQGRGADAGRIARAAATSVGGSGGGRADMAQAGVKDAGRLSEALAAVGPALAAGAATSAAPGTTPVAATGKARGA